MSDPQKTLDHLGIKLPDGVYPDAIQLIGSEEGWLIQILCWRSETSDYLVADVDPKTGELTHEKTVCGLQIDPKTVYGNRTMARLFARFNSAAPSLSFMQPNEEHLR